MGASRIQQKCQGMMSEARSSEALHTPALSSGRLTLEEPCREGAQAALWSVLVVRPAPAPALQHTSESPWTSILQPQSSLQMTVAPTCEQSQTQTPVSYRLSDPLKPSEVTEDCFKPLSFGDICYSATVARTANT